MAKKIKLEDIDFETFKTIYEIGYNAAENDDDIAVNILKQELKVEDRYNFFIRKAKIKTIMERAKKQQNR